MFGRRARQRILWKQRSSIGWSLIAVFGVLLVLVTLLGQTAGAQQGDVVGLGSGRDTYLPLITRGSGVVPPTATAIPPTATAIPPTATTIPPTATTTPPGSFPTRITWSNAAPQPFSNSEAQGAVVGGKLYSFGGFAPCCTPTDRAYVFDPAANSWTPIESMPRMQGGTVRGGVTHAGIATDGRYIYFAGGYTANTAGTGQLFGTKEVWKYDVVTNQYSFMTPLPVDRAAGQLVVVGRNLHYIGGTNRARTQDVGDHWVLNLDGGTSWATKAALPNPRHHAAAVALNGKIYYIGGQHGHDGVLVPQADVHVYDPATDKWTQVRSMNKPTNHHGNSTFVLNGRIVVVGGQVKHGSKISDVVAYNPSTDSWSALTPLPTARHSAVGQVINGVLYFTTGDTSETKKGIFGN